MFLVVHSDAVEKHVTHQFPCHSYGLYRQIMVLNRVQLSEVCVLTLARVCVCECTVSCRHVFLCRNRNKIKPSLVLKTSCVSVHTVFTFTGCIESTVCCCVTYCTAIYSSGTSAIWSCARWKMRDGSRSLACCSPAPFVIIYRRYETHLHGDLGWQGTLITARLPASPLCSLSPPDTPQLMIITAGNEDHFDV